MHTSMCVCVHAAAAAAVHLLSIRVNYSQHVRPEHSSQSSRAAASRLCVTALSSMANMVYQGRPHKSVFIKT